MAPKQPKLMVAYQRRTVIEVPKQWTRRRRWAEVSRRPTENGGERAIERQIRRIPDEVA